jgi:hypothetical protein
VNAGPWTGGQGGATWGSTALPERAAPAGLISVDLGDDGGGGSRGGGSDSDSDDDDSIDDDDDEGMLV